jgi:hypothetical protein
MFITLPTSYKDVLRKKGAFYATELCFHESTFPFCLLTQYYIDIKTDTC